MLHSRTAVRTEGKWPVDLSKWGSQTAEFGAKLGSVDSAEYFRDADMGDQKITYR
jgi:hypothetical protein